jgi:hypothetical protein
MLSIAGGVICYRLVVPLRYSERMSVSKRAFAID